jgi:hypothetical protein
VSYYELLTSCPVVPTIESHSEFQTRPYLDSDIM